MKPSKLIDDYDGFLKPKGSVKERIANGKKLRELCPRTSHADWRAPSERKDPLEWLSSQDVSRVQSLVPLRYGRMMYSPFTFLRGAALIMASDLAFMGSSGAIVQLCGDCHLSNFGIFATPERNIVFDLNDFDETLPGPFEWDLKRLGVSIAAAAIDNKLSKTAAARCVEACSKAYRKRMEQFAYKTALDVWYDRVDWQYLIDRISKPGSKQALNLETLRTRRSHAGAVAKLTEVIDGKRRIKDNPPLIYHSDIATADAMNQVFLSYLSSLWESRQRLLQRYSFVDVAQKVVGIGSVGTAAAIVLLEGEGGELDQIFLQVKEANSSVLERFLGQSQYRHHGERVVHGQRLLQSASDLFLGWTQGPRRQFYVRQLMDHKASVPIDELDADSLANYAAVCGYVLARGHARSGDPAVIHGYLGTSTTFDEALSKFALAYLKQNEQDFSVLLKAIKSGAVEARSVGKE